MAQQRGGIDSRMAVTALTSESNDDEYSYFNDSSNTKQQKDDVGYVFFRPKQSEDNTKPSPPPSQLPPPSSMQQPPPPPPQPPAQIHQQPPQVPSPTINNTNNNNNESSNNNNNQQGDNTPPKCTLSYCCICTLGLPASFQTPPTWSEVCRVAMYALEQGHKNRKFFHIRKEICPFIDAHYEKLVPKTKSVSWRQTVNMTLSHPQYAHIFMQESQDHEFGRRKGYYSLRQNIDLYKIPEPEKKSRRKRYFDDAIDSKRKKAKKSRKRISKSTGDSSDEDDEDGATDGAGTKRLIKKLETDLFLYFLERKSHASDDDEPGSSNESSPPPNHESVDTPPPTKSVTDTTNEHIVPDTVTTTTTTTTTKQSVTTTSSTLKSNREGKIIQVDGAASITFNTLPPDKEPIIPKPENTTSSISSSSEEPSTSASTPPKPSPKETPKPTQLSAPQAASNSNTSSKPVSLSHIINSDDQDEEKEGYIAPRSKSSDWYPPPTLGKSSWESNLQNKQDSTSKLPPSKPGWDSNLLNSPAKDSEIHWAPRSNSWELPNAKYPYPTPQQERFNTPTKNNKPSDDPPLRPNFSDSAEFSHPQQASQYPHYKNELTPHSRSTPSPPLMGRAASPLPPASRLQSPHMTHQTPHSPQLSSHQFMHNHGKQSPVTWQFDYQHSQHSQQSPQHHSQNPQHPHQTSTPPPPPPPPPPPGFSSHQYPILPPYPYPGYSPQHSHEQKPPQPPPAHSPHSPLQSSSPSQNPGQSQQPQRRNRLTTRPWERAILEDYYTNYFCQSRHSRREKVKVDELVSKLGWEISRIQRWLDNRRTKDRPKFGHPQFGSTRSDGMSSDEEDELAPKKSPSDISSPLSPSPTTTTKSPKLKPEPKLLDPSKSPKLKHSNSDNDSDVDSIKRRKTTTPSKDDPNPPNPNHANADFWVIRNK